jgi:hypothetical protein
VPAHLSMDSRAECPRIGHSVSRLDTIVLPLDTIASFLGSSVQQLDTTPHSWTLPRLLACPIVQWVVALTLRTSTPTSPLSFECFGTRGPPYRSRTKNSIKFIRPFRSLRPIRAILQRACRWGEIPIDTGRRLCQDSANERVDSRSKLE